MTEKYMIEYAGKDWKKKTAVFSEKKHFLLFLKCLDRRINTGTVSYYKSMKV